MFGNISPSEIRLDPAHFLSQRITDGVAVHDLSHIRLPRPGSGLRAHKRRCQFFNRREGTFLPRNRMAVSISAFAAAEILSLSASLSSPLYR